MESQPDTKVPQIHVKKILFFFSQRQLLYFRFIAVCRKASNLHQIDSGSVG